MPDAEYASIVKRKVMSAKKGETKKNDYPDLEFVCGR